MTDTKVDLEQTTARHLKRQGRLRILLALLAPLSLAVIGIGPYLEERLLGAIILLVAVIAWLETRIADNWAKAWRLARDYPRPENWRQN